MTIDKGNWRKESTSSPYLPAKSCHDIDFLLWLLCSPAPNSKKPLHLPIKITSIGSQRYLHNSCKPIEFGNAASCFSCAYEPSCKFSSKNIYLGPNIRGLATGNTHLPVHIVVPEIEDIVRTSGQQGSRQYLQNCKRIMTIGRQPLRLKPKRGSGAASMDLAMM